MIKREHVLTIWLVLAAFLACGTSLSDLPTQEQAQSALQTAEALKNQAGELATQAAPTLAALATQAAGVATQVGPTLEAGASQLATAAAQAQATMVAAGVDLDYLKQKAASLTPDENGNVTLVVTEAEITAVILARQNTTGQNQIEDLQVRLTSGSIYITGRVTDPVEGDVILVLQPVVTNGQLSLTVVSAAVNDRALPEAIMTQMQDKLDSILLEAVNNMPGRVELKSITITEGQMAIVAGPQ